MRQQSHGKDEFAAAPAHTWPFVHSHDSIQNEMQESRQYSALPLWENNPPQPPRTVCGRRQTQPTESKRYAPEPENLAPNAQFHHSEAEDAGNAQHTSPATSDMNYLEEASNVANMEVPTPRTKKRVGSLSGMEDMRFCRPKDDDMFDRLWYGSDSEQYRLFQSRPGSHTDEGEDAEKGHEEYQGREASAHADALDEEEACAEEFHRQSESKQAAEFFSDFPQDDVAITHHGAQDTHKHDFYETGHLPATTSSLPPASTYPPKSTRRITTRSVGRQPQLQSTPNDDGPAHRSTSLGGEGYDHAANAHHALSSPPPPLSFHNHNRASPFQHPPAHAAPHSREVLPVHLFVAAVGEGEVDCAMPHKTRELLAQIKSKGPKEQNTVVQLGQGGLLQMQLRVFAHRSAEAQAIKEYIFARPQQAPCPFVLLARALPMAVLYEPRFIDPSHASVADRLRKQAKTRAIQLLKDIILKSECGVTENMLKGKEGPLLPESVLDPLIDARARVLDGVGTVATADRLIAFDAVRRQGEGGGADPMRSVDKMAPVRIEESPKVNRQLPFQKTDANFPVVLTAIGIGEGAVDPSSRTKLLKRLHQLTHNVPKEHRCTLDVPQRGAQAYNMRLFVANSEDAKAALEYVEAHRGQTPAPFVILAHALPIMVSYEAGSQDVTNANVVDCLRKQAKTRALRLLKDTISDASVGVTLEQLRGHEGSLALAERMEARLMQHAIEIKGGRRYILFAARRRQAKPAKRELDEEAFELDSVASAPVSIGSRRSWQGGQDGSDDDERGGGRGGGEGWEEGGHPSIGSEPRMCEICGRQNDGSYGTGRFCSKSCRYEAHALRVATKTKRSGSGHSTPHATPKRAATRRSAAERTGRRSAGGEGGDEEGEGEAAVLYVEGAEADEAGARWPWGTAVTEGGGERKRRRAVVVKTEDGEGGAGYHEEARRYATRRR